MSRGYTQLEPTVELRKLGLGVIAGDSEIRNPGFSLHPSFLSIVGDPKPNPQTGCRWVAGEKRMKVILTLEAALSLDQETCVQICFLIIR